MKKEGIITLIIVIVIIIGDFAMQTYTNKQLGKVEEELKELKERILTDEKEEEGTDSDTKPLLERTNKIYEEWEEKNKILSYYLEHDELEKVNTQMVLVKGYLEIEDAEEAVPEIEEGLYILEHIRKKEELSLRNIF